MNTQIVIKPFRNSNSECSKLDNLKRLSVMAKILSFLSTTRILCVLASRSEVNKILRTGALK